MAKSATTTKTETVSISIEDQLKAAKEQLRAKKDDLKTAAWIEAKKAKNPQFTGQSRPVTDEDALLHTHGSVLWEIKCAECGDSRWINAQDTHQVQFCLTHKKKGKKKGNTEATAKQLAETLAKLKALSALS